MQSSATPYQSSRILIDHSTDGLRSGEGSIVPLKNGNLLLLYSDFSDGGGDADSAQIVGMISVDSGKTWSQPHTVFASPKDVLNVMSVSLVRLDDDRLGCIFDVKFSLGRLIPHWSYSQDEGETWSQPTPITQEDGYFVVNNDRLIRHTSGLLILPYALHLKVDSKEQYEHWNPIWNAICGVFYSSDNGATWKRSSQTITHTPEYFCLPKGYREDFDWHPNVKYQLDHRLGVFQESGVEELRDGTLMLYCRSSYAIYRCFAKDVESPWIDCAPISELNVCMGPQTIRRLPDSNVLLLFYNDRKDILFGQPYFSWRTPLSIAISRDEGRSWQHWRDIEGSGKNYCYFSVIFDQGICYLTYYESAETQTSEGTYKRRNLASLKFTRLDREFFSVLKA